MTYINPAHLTLTDGYFADGNAANPSIKFTNDPDTGIFRIGANDVGFATGGIKAVEIDSTGGATITHTGVGYGLTINPQTNGGSGITIRNDNINEFAGWGGSGQELYGFYQGGPNGAIWSATLEMRTPTAGSTATTVAGRMILKNGTPNRVAPVISYDGYGFHDVFTGKVFYKTSDQSTSSATLANDNDFSTTLDANSRYMFEGYYQINNDTASEGFKIDLSGTAAVLTLAAVIEGGQSTLAAGSLTSLGSGGVGSTLGGTGLGFIYITGAIEISTSGTFRVQIAQNAHVAGATTFKKGSWFKIHKI